MDHKMMYMKKKVRHVPISMQQLEDDDMKAKLQEHSVDNPIFDLESLRKPAHALSQTTKR